MTQRVATARFLLYEPVWCYRFYETQTTRRMRLRQPWPPAVPIPVCHVHLSASGMSQCTSACMCVPCPSLPAGSPGKGATRDLVSCTMCRCVGTSFVNNQCSPCIVPHCPLSCECVALWSCARSLPLAPDGRRDAVLARASRDSNECRRRVAERCVHHTRKLLSPLLYACPLASCAGCTRTCIPTC